MRVSHDEPDEKHIRRLGPMLLDTRVNLAQVIEMFGILGVGIYAFAVMDAQVARNKEDIAENRTYIQKVDERSLDRDEKIVQTIENIRMEIRRGFDRLADKIDNKADK